MRPLAATRRHEPHILEIPVNRLLPCALLVLFAAPALAQQDHPILKDVLRIQKKVEQLRGLKFQAPVKVGVQKPSALKKMLFKDFEKEVPVAETDKEEKVLKAFGLIPRTFQLRKQMMKFLGDQIGGFYLPDKKQLFLVDRSDQMKKKGGMFNNPRAQKMNDQMVMAHELHHALQDQNFALDRWFEVLGDHADRVQGYKSLVEGEAQLIGMTYLMQTMGRGGQPDMKRMNNMNRMMMRMSPQGRKLAKMPPYLVENMMFPYTEGSEFVQALFRKYGWKGVSKAFHNPPTSTEQILHPDKFYNRDEPQEIRLPKGLKKVLGKGAQELSENTLGEFSVTLLLRALGLSRADALRAATGWDGDRYRGFEVGGRVVVVWLSTWDTQADAAKFVAAYKPAYARYAAGSHVEQRGTEVLMVSGATAAELPQLVKKAFRSVKVEERWRPMPDLVSKPPRSDFTQEAPLAKKPTGTDSPHTPQPRVRRIQPPVKVTPTGHVRMHRRDDMGIAFVLPKGFIETADPIKGLKQFSHAYFEGPHGMKLRLLAFPVPLGTAKQQMATMIQGGMQGVTIHENKDVTFQGQKATRMVFEATLPGDQKASSATALMVGMGPGTLTLGITFPKGVKAAIAKQTFQKILGTLWLDRTGAKLGTPVKSNRVQVGGHQLSIPNVLKNARVQGSGPLAYSQADANGGKVQVVVQSAKASDDLNRFGERLEAQLPHLGATIGSAGVILRKGLLVHEIEFVRGARRFRQLTLFKGGKRWTVSCSAPSGKFDTYRGPFGRVLAGFRVVAKGKKRREVY